MTQYKFRMIKLLIFSIVGTTLLILSAIFLRTVALSPARASGQEHQKITKNTILYKDNTLETAIMELPGGYYLTPLSTNGEITRVTYNGVTGFVRSDSLTTGTTSGELHERADIQTKADAGTYLRESANTESKKIGLISPSTPLEYLGRLIGETPSDGTTNVWYYVNFNISSTATVRGYVYGERVNIKVTTLPDSQSETSLSTPTSTTTTETKTEPTELPLPKTALSSGLKLFLVILFVILAVIIFTLLLISPKGRTQKKLEPQPRQAEYSSELVSSKRNTHHTPVVKKFSRVNEHNLSRFFNLDDRDD